MNEEILAALDQLEKEKGIPKDYMVEKITQALLAAYKKNSTGYTDNVFIDGSGSAMRMYVQKEVVEDVISPATEIELSKAREVEPTCQLGDLVSLEMETSSFSRIAAQTAKQVIIQGMREAERGMVFERYNSREHEILTGTVLRIEPQTGDITVRIGTPADHTEALLAAGEQIRGESYHEGDMIRVYVVEVRRSARGPQIMVSRTHPGLVKRLFELEVPEIADGTGGDSLHRPRGGQPHQAGCLGRGPGHGSGRRLRRPPGRPCRRRGGGAPRREDGHRPLSMRSPKSSSLRRSARPTSSPSSARRAPRPAASSSPTTS